MDKLIAYRYWLTSLMPFICMRNDPWLRKAQRAVAGPEPV